QIGQLSLPISLGYSSNGIKVKDFGGRVGVGWQLNAGGKIERELRGLPDDCQQDLMGTARLGWMYNTNGTKIQNFNLANDNNVNTCTDEATDLAYLNSNFADLSDTEPDIFNVNAPGLSVRLVFDNNHVIKTIPYQDVQVSYTTDPAGEINSFTIVNDKGIKYEFSDLETTQQFAKSNSPTYIQYFKRIYNQFANGVKFNSSWQLSKITDPNGNVIQFKYVSRNSTGSSDSFLSAFKMNSDYGEKDLQEILYGHGILKSALLFSGYPLKQITGSDKTINLWYYDVSYLKPEIADKFYYRSFLNKISTNQSVCPDPNFYQFEYNNEVSTTGQSYSTILPDSLSNAVDYWGYYNPNSTSLNPKIFINPSNSSLERYRFLGAGASTSSFSYLVDGYDRSANELTVSTGMLKKVTYPFGGTSTITYSSNDFFDNTANNVAKGGGARVQQIVEYDGISSVNNIVRNFSYINPLTGLSSGKALSMPIFAFTSPYVANESSSQLWINSTVRSQDNLSQVDNTILYSHVEESKPGAGSTLYEFSVPGTNWESSNPPDWASTLSNVGRANCNSAGFLINDKNTYPFAPNVNYEFERGLIKKSTNFNGTGAIVSESTYSYTRSNNPTIISALKFDDNNGIRMYSKYTLLASTIELSSQVVNKIFDSSTLTQAQQSTLNSYYESLNHKLVTKSQQTNSDGSINRSFNIYSKDYNTTNATDANATALQLLKAKNINIPIETYNTIELNGVSKTVSGSLTKFNSFNPDGSNILILPEKNLGFLSQQGVTDFQTSKVNAGIFSADSRYFVTGNYLNYDSYGYLMSSDDNFKNKNSILRDHTTSLPVLSISNTLIKEFAYNDFDSDTEGNKFLKTDNTYSYSLNSRSGKNSLSITSSDVLSSTVIKNDKAKSYTFSIWLNSYNAGSLNITLTNASSQTFSYPIAYGNTSGWKYYELNIPVVNMSTNFTVKLQSNSSLMIDDILFYPEVSEVNTVSYDNQKLVKTSETNTNGVSTYYAYDEIGRLVNVLDQDKQIQLRNGYVARVTPESLFKPYPISNLPVLKRDKPVIFSTPKYCIDGVTFTWNFGEGAIVTTNTPVAPAHTYATGGAKTVTVTAKDPATQVVKNGFATFFVEALPVTVKYISSSAMSGRITGINFFRNGVQEYNLTIPAGTFSAQITIPQGVYTVSVSYVKTTAFKSVTLNVGDVPSCFPTNTSPASLQFDLTNVTRLEFIPSTVDCLN
ncbi:MAG: hypothetical protein JWQ25_1623, partial [Daejeonella sp.]|nr:hypothetical protein [Daejeonella sp.]